MKPAPPVTIAWERELTPCNLQRRNRNGHGKQVLDGLDRLVYALEHPDGALISCESLAQCATPEDDGNLGMVRTELLGRALHRAGDRRVGCAEDDEGGGLTFHLGQQLLDRQIGLERRLVARRRELVANHLQPERVRVPAK